MTSAPGRFHKGVCVIPPRGRAQVECLEQRQLLSTSWFVSPSGSNSNPGTLAAPFQTIQAAANAAKAGDVVDIEAGTYHETVVPANSGTPGDPIVYQAYNGESVTISGADPITGWSNDTGDISDAPMTASLGEGNNEVFVNGQAINEAAFPNSAIGDVSTPATLTMSSVHVSGNTAVIYSSALNQPANTWKGATIHMDPGQAWIDETGTVTSSSPGSITISFNNLGGSYYAPSAGNPFYLVGSFKALTGPGQWYIDPTSNRIYAWMPNSGNPASENVEVKHRDYAFNLDNVHDITIRDINVFAATITSGYHSSDTVINGVTAMYPTQQMLVTNGWNVPGTDGILIAGSNSIVENSIVAFSSGDGIVIAGSNSTAENDIVHDVSYAGANTGAILIYGVNATVEHDTIFNSGRDGVLIAASHATITYNTVSSVGLQTTEPGGIYTAKINGEGAVIAYNTVYNIHTGGYGGTALFLDNGSSNWIVHNNITYNVDYAFKMNFTSNNDVIYNNTLGATKMSVDTDQDGNWDGSKIYNNVFTAPVLFTSGVSAYNNATSAASANSSQGAGNYASGAPADVGASGVVNSGPSSGGASPAAASASTAASENGTGSSGSGSATAASGTTSSGSGSTASGVGTTSSSPTASTGSASTTSTNSTAAATTGITDPVVLYGPFLTLPATVTTTTAASSSAPATVADLQGKVTADQAAVTAAIALRKQTIKAQSSKRLADLAAVHAAARQLSAARHTSKAVSLKADAAPNLAELSTELVQLQQTLQADTTLLHTDLRSDFTDITAKKQALALDIKSLHSLMHADRKPT